jgi:amidophosphoribosyltransferase
VNSPYGIALAHNGNLINTDALRREVFEQDKRNVNTESDSEVLLNVLAHELGVQGPLTPDPCSARSKACIAVAAKATRSWHRAGPGAGRLPRPARHPAAGAGPRETEAGSRVRGRFRKRGAGPARLHPRARRVAGRSGRGHGARRTVLSDQCAAGEHAPCIFEYVYFARPDSMIENVSVHKARMRMGVTLGEKILRLRPDHDIDTVIPIPDSSRDAALEVANTLGVKYREGFIKNRYVGRTFIMPGQSERVKSVRRKLNPIPLEFRNRVVLLVDDSIVRGTTSQQIVQMARDAGAKKVYLASAAPPVRYPNVYGIDMPSAGRTGRSRRSDEEVQTLLGCDWLIYQDLADLEWAVAGQRRAHASSTAPVSTATTSPASSRTISNVSSSCARTRRRRSGGWRRNFLFAGAGTRVGASMWRRIVM